MGGYISPEEATKVRVFVDGNLWNIDAADDLDNYTEAVWTHGPTEGDRFARPRVCGEWGELIDEVMAIALVPLFIKSVVPHLQGTTPIVYEQEEEDD